MSDKPVQASDAKSKQVSRYYLVVDNATQWFTRLVRVDYGRWNEGGQPKEQEEKTVIEDVPTLILSRPFLSNVYNREPAFAHRYFRGDDYYGWTLSEWEYHRIARLIALTPSVEEFNKLAGYNV